MMVYLKHPRHGKKIAYLQGEVDADKENGWVEYNPDEEKKNGVQREEEQEAPEEKVNGYLDMDEIKAALDKLNIRYRKNANRETLVNLLEEANGRADAN